MDAGKLRHKVAWYQKLKAKNEQGKTTYEDRFVKYIWCDIIPQTNNMQHRPADTILTKCTHKIKCRYLSGKEIQNNGHFIYRGRRFDIKYVTEPYFAQEYLEIFVEEVIE